LAACSAPVLGARALVNGIGRLVNEKPHRALARSSTRRWIGVRSEGKLRRSRAWFKPPRHRPGVFWGQLSTPAFRNPDFVPAGIEMMRWCRS